MIERERIAVYEKSKYSTLVDSITEVLIQVDSKLKIVFMNKSSLAGIKREELLEKNAKETVIYNKLLEEILSKNQILSWSLNLNGKTFNVKASPLQNDEIFGVCMLFNDVSEIIQSHQAEIKAVKAMESLQGKVEFIASVSHEIRTPLQAITFSLENLELSNLSETQSEITKDIHISTNLLKVIIQDILDLSKFETGKTSLTIGKVILIDIVETAITLNANNAHQKNLFVMNYFNLDIPLEINGDHSRIIQILSNLINNSIKYTKVGNIIIRITKDHEFIKFSVEDTGIGIKEEDYSKIFLPFSQITSLKNPTEFQGWGLGLSISKN